MFFHGFVKIDRWISLSCYMDLSKLKQGFVKVATWTDQTCFSPFAKKKLNFDQDFQA